MIEGLNLCGCEIVIKEGIFSSELPIRFKPLGSKFAIITDDKVASLYAHQLHQMLSASGLETHLFTFPSGECYKTRATKEYLENQLFEKKFGRDTCVVALGGGVVSDLAGYLAATYCRGVSFITIPTSLIGMVDASIGGKTGVNAPYGKNMFGCIYQPQQVLIDPKLLLSLPLRELKNGIVEMLKSALIADAHFFTFLEMHVKELLTLETKTLLKCIFESCRIKKEIVEQDEKENGIRRLLNFGHTIGHALENLSQYELAHGEAVAIGMLIESHLAMQLTHLDKVSFVRILNLLRAYCIPLQFPYRLTTEAIQEAMVLDKKSLKGKPRFVILNQIGGALAFESNYCTNVKEELIKIALDWMSNDLCCH